ncbi:ASCH domain-containing protein, partial [Streptococcus sp.]|uniref:ASCH domain-containing protein n=1 Tax=Streptococcus sp. TaxID=1306 RepID=UPI0035A042D9
YKAINPEIGDEIDAWAFGVAPDLLAELVVQGVKTATASAYDEYVYYEEELPKVGDLDVVLDGQGQAVAIIETTKVTVIPFRDVSADHAYKEGEGDRSLTYWRQVHEEFFTKWLAQIGLTFSPESKVVLEEFQVVYKSVKDS